MNYSHEHTPFMLWSRGKGGDGPCPCCRAWETVKPNFIAFATADSGADTLERYRRLYPAQEFAISDKQPPAATVSLDSLCGEYNAWNSAQGLALGSADEHIADPDLTVGQRDWLRDFSARWEAIESAEFPPHLIP